MRRRRIVAQLPWDRDPFAQWFPIGERTLVGRDAERSLNRTKERCWYVDETKNEVANEHFVTARERHRRALDVLAEADYMRRRRITLLRVARRLGKTCGPVVRRIVENEAHRLDREVILLEQRAAGLHAAGRVHFQNGLQKERDHLEKLGLWEARNDEAKAA